MEEFLNVLKDVKFVVDSAIVLVEHPGDGENKKSKVMKIVNDFISENGIKLPIPSAILNWIIGEVIDMSVRWLNENFWKKEKQN